MKTIILYGYPLECEAFRQYLKEYTISCLSEQDELISSLMKKSPAAVFVIMEKAAGMEGVFAIRKIYPEIPVAWFSNDSGFAAQAYRLNVDYFTLMPVNEGKMKMALKKMKLTSENI